MSLARKGFAFIARMSSNDIKPCHDRANFRLVVCTKLRKISGEKHKVTNLQFQMLRAISACKNIFSGFIYTLRAVIFKSNFNWQLLNITRRVLLAHIDLTEAYDLQKSMLELFAEII